MMPSNHDQFFVSKIGVVDSETRREKKNLRRAGAAAERRKHFIAFAHTQLTGYSIRNSRGEKKTNSILNEIPSTFFFDKKAKEEWEKSNEKSSLDWILPLNGPQNVSILEDPKRSSI